MAPTELVVEPADASSPEVLALFAELSQVLTQLTGDAGTSSFRLEDLNDVRALVLVARDHGGTACACGVLRPLESDSTGHSGELKRMYARQHGQGTGSAVLSALERQARSLGYRQLYLATRRVNERAVAFYLRHGYLECPPFGRYVGRSMSICLRKQLG